MNKSHILRKILFYGLLILFFVETISSMPLKSLTFDETAHIPAGYVYLTKHEFHLNREHPPLIKEIAAVPLLLLSLPEPERIGAYDNPRGEWEFGYRFLYLSGIDVEKTAFWARFPMILIAVALGLGVYFWAKDFFGEFAALVALGFFALSPNILAHSRLVTTDIGLCTFIIWQQYLLWRFLRDGKLKLLAISAVIMGLALATKYTALLLIPFSMLQVFTHFFLLRRNDKNNNHNTRSVLFYFGILTGLAALVLWACYFFRLAPYPFADYIEGFKLALKFRAKWSFFFGEAKQGSWLFYFPAVFLLKTPIPTIILSAPGVYFLLKAHRSPTDHVFIVLAPIAFFLIAMASGMNIGYRHILHVLPYAFILAGYGVAKIWEAKIQLARIGVILLSLWYIVLSINIAPHYLTYFNEIAGGPKGGPRYFADSNIDWGQELIGLRNYLRKNEIEHVRLSYFGTASPLAYGLPCTLLPSRNLPIKTEELSEPPEPGYYAISVTNLRIPVPGYPPDYFHYFLEREPLARVGNSIYFYQVH